MGATLVRGPATERRQGLDRRMAIVQERTKALDDVSGAELLTDGPSFFLEACRRVREAACRYDQRADDVVPVSGQVIHTEHRTLPYIAVPGRCTMFVCTRASGSLAFVTSRAAVAIHNA